MFLHRQIQETMNRPGPAPVRDCRWRLVRRCRAMAGAVLAGCLGQVVFAQEPLSSPALPRDRFRSGEEVLRVLAPMSKAVRDSIVKLNVDGETVALGTVMDTNGLVLTKASEVRAGKLTCWLATEQEVRAELLGIDEDEDVALVRVQARGLKPIRWAVGEVSVGQWAITAGVAETPHAIGIVSALPRRIRPQRAFIGVQFDFTTSLPKVETLLAGLGAEKAGVKPGDIIAAVNGTAVTNREQVVEILRELREGQAVKLRLDRAAEHLEVEVTLMLPKPSQLGLGYDPEQRRNPLSGEVSQRAEGFERAIEHDTVLAPWLCGGPLLDLEGQAIGLNIARAARVSTYALPAGLVRRIFDGLKSKYGRAAATRTSNSPAK